MKVFLDANVLFSAALPGSLMGRFLEVVRSKAEVVSNRAAVDEAVRNLDRKFSSRLPHLQSLVQSITVTQFVAELPGVELVEKDRHILGAAVASRCSHLLTGDERHFQHLFGKAVLGVKVVNAALFAKEIGLKKIDRKPSKAD